MKHTLIAAGSFLLAASFVVSVLAQTTGTPMMHGSESGMMPSSLMMMHPPMPMVLTVSANGHGLLRGVVESVGTSSLMVAAWGGIWTVTVGSGTTIAPVNNLSQIAVGHFIGALGSVSEDTPTIATDYVRDWTTTKKGAM